MAFASVLAWVQAVAMGIYVVRAFVQLRQASSVHADLAKRLAELERSTERLEMQHDTFNRNTRNQLRQVFEALRELTALPEAAPNSLLGLSTQRAARASQASCESSRACHGLDVGAGDAITEINPLSI